MGGNRDAHVHLIVPTCFSVYYLEEKEIETDADHYDARQRHLECQTACAICSVALAPHKLLSYQMVLRVVGGQKLDSTWQYDVLHGMLCRHCRTSRPHELIAISEQEYETITSVINREGFKGHPFNNRQPLVPQYVARFEVLNELIAELMPKMIGTRATRRCFYCDERGFRCERCFSIGLCKNKCHPVAHGGAHGCAETGMCHRLMRWGLFHIHAICIITVDGRCEHYGESEE